MKLLLIFQIQILLINLEEFYNFFYLQKKLNKNEGFL